MTSQEQQEQQERHWDRWFRRIEAEFAEVILPYAGRPVTYVEIGCWAGASAEWVCRNILTHPESQGYGIDPYPAERRHPQQEIDAIKERARSRVAMTQAGSRWIWLLNDSKVVLCEWADYKAENNEIDILYIDGSHDAQDVVQDFALAWPMLKAGSLVIFDDYTVKAPKATPNVREAVLAIESCWAGLIMSVGRRRRQAAFVVIEKSHAQ